MSGARYIVGDVFQVLATLPDDSVDLVVSSPPFLALRSYLPADHPDKAREIGSEATPGEFIDTMLDVVEACGRVLAPHGSLVFELGDTYAGSGNGPDANQDGRDLWATAASPRQVNARASRALDEAAGLTRRRARPGPAERDHVVGWPLDKSKCLIPQLFAIALAYGFNPLPGRETEPWRVRNVVAWARPNPPVGRDGDKFRPATSYLTVATKTRDRYWDGDAVRVPAATDDSRRDEGPQQYEPSGQPGRQTFRTANAAGAPLLDYWVIPTEPYAGSHYATFPRKLVVPVIKAMTPQRVCRVCGEPSRRITETEYVEAPNRPLRDDEARRYGSIDGKRHNDHRATAQNTLGWTDCGCCAECSIRRSAGTTETADCRTHGDHWRPGVVLDPFAGSGTTLAVATGHGFDAIGIDLDSRNTDLAAERIGPMFLTVETLDAEPAA